MKIILSGISVLRSLNKQHFSGISERVKDQAAKVASLQCEVLTNPSESVIREENQARSRWNFLLSAAEKFFRQKSRVNWMDLGDKNTAFFHKSVSQRAAKNHIHFLRDEDDRKIATAAEIKAHASDYFQGIIGCTNMPLSPASLSSLQNLIPFRCTEAQCADLQKTVTDQEVKAAVFAMPLNKSPGPDGFSVEFFRASWETVGNDVIKAVKEFFVNGRLLKDFNNTVIALIPKQPEACKLGEYRPISCCNLIYKVISKIIALRLKPILQDCISPNQAAFLKGRSLGENVLLASELFRNYQKSNCPKSCMLKLDIRKAFDTVCWDFVLKILQAQNFPPIFCTWIKECISSPRFSISVNGELAGFFSGQKGLRQGDPISPYLFIMVMEVLSNLLSNAAAQGKFRLHPSCADPCITHLLFADDLLIFTDGSRHSLSGISEVMQHFKSICGMDVNPTKSELFFGGYSDIQVAVLSALQGIRPGTFPTRYLGLPLNPARISFATLQPFLEKITNKLHSWTVRFLSFAGKIRLISSVIYGMVNFWSAVFNLPKRFYAKIDSICAAFLWKNKVTNATGSRVSWQDVCKPKAEGGLGIRLLEDFAIVFQLKLIWNIFANAGSLWVAWLKGNIFQRKSYWTLEDSPRLSGTLKKLLQLKPTIIEFLKCEVRDGQSASFWFDNWTDLGPLMGFIGATGPRQLRIRKEGLVADVVRNGEWQLPGAQSEAQQQLMIKLTTIAPPNDSNGPDVYLWRRMAGTFMDSFSSKETWEQLRLQSPIVPWHKVVWFKEGVPRYSFITWLAMRGRLPTRDRLRTWGLNVPAACVLCSAGLETHDHLFFECSFSSDVWRSFASRIMSQPPNILSAISSWLLQVGGQAHLAQASILIKLVLQASCYIIWRERNARIFNSSPSSAQVLQASLDRSLRDRLLPIPASSSRSLSLLAVYFGCISFPF